MQASSLLLFICISLTWCVSSGFTCGNKKCNTWSEYFDDFHECRTNGAVDRFTTFFLSFIPFSGLNNFYRRDRVIGLCELLNGIMMIVAAVALLICHKPNARRYNHDASFVAVVVGLIVAFLDFSKVVHIGIAYENGSIDICEIIILIITIITVWLHCVVREYPIVAALQVTFVTGISEALKDIITAILYAKDGKGCPFT